jgi:hypothetical protein
MAENLSLQEVINEFGDLIKVKEDTVAELNHKSYTLFRKIILFRDRTLLDESQDLEKLSESIRFFINTMKVRIPESISKLNINQEISSDSKAKQKSLLLSTQGLNELLGLLESIAIELTRDESYQASEVSENKVKALVDSVKALTNDIRIFITWVQRDVEQVQPASLYTVEGHIIGVTLIMAYSFICALNLSIIRLTKVDYEQTYFGYDPNNLELLDLLLPLSGIPGYIFLHYISTRISMKVSFVVSLTLMVVGNAFFYLARGAGGDPIDVTTEPIFFTFYMIGKGIIVSRLPMYGAKQFIGYHVEAKKRTKLATCFIAAYFLGLCCGYFLSLAFLNYEGNFLAFETTGYNIGGLLSGTSWLVVTLFCGVLFVNPENNIKYRSPGHPKLYIQAFTIVSYILPFTLLQAFVSPHAIPSTLNWNEEKFFTFLGVFCLMVLPVHGLVYISSNFTTDKTLILSSKITCVIGGLLTFCIVFNQQTDEFFYVIGGLLMVVGINLGLGANFSLLSDNIKNHRIGLFAGVLEVIGLVIGNVGIEFESVGEINVNKSKTLAQVVFIIILLITLMLDIWKFNYFDAVETDQEVNSDKKDN